MTDAHSYSWGVTSTLYSRDILRLAASIPHLGRLPDPEASVERNSPVCGSRVVVDLSLDEAGHVAAIGMVVKACALGQASAALLGRHIIGSDATALAAASEALGAFLAGDREDPGDWPGLEVFAEARRFSARHPSIRLAFEAASEAAAQAEATAPASARRSSRPSRLPG